MINTPSDKIVFSVSEQNRINLLEKRLLDFQADITVAKKLRDELKAECESLAKEKTYQEELLANTQSQLSFKKKELETAITQLAKVQDEAEETNKRSLETNKVQDTRQKALDKREADLSELEQIHSKDKVSFVRERDSVSKDKESIRSAKKLLSEAIGKIDL